MSLSKALFTFLLVPLAIGLLGSTCVVVEEGVAPYGEDGTYADESAGEAMQEEQTEDVIRDSER
jgi:hypothetical protein